MPAVSVIIPHFNDLKGLDLCLSALASQITDCAEFEIIVADNNSPIAKEDIEQTIGGRAKLVVVEEKGAGPARNGGVKAAAAPILAFTDSDCIPEPTWLKEGVEALGRFDLIGGGVKVLVENENNLTPVEAFERVFAFDNRRYIEAEKFTVTANLFCRRDSFEDIGPFKVGLSEDKEWCNRGVDRGFSIGYVGGAVVGHPARKSWAELKKKWARIDLETYGLLSGSLKSRLFWCARSFVVLASIVPHTMKIMRSDKLKHRSSRLAAFRILVKQRCWRFLHYWNLLINN